MARKIKVKRAYEPAAEDDGARILVDRFWPCGISKEELRIDYWAKDVAPSNELRKWYGHDPEKWEEFRERYFAELRANPDGVRELIEILPFDLPLQQQGAGDQQCSCLGRFSEVHVAATLIKKPPSGFDGGFCFCQVSGELSSGLGCCDECEVLRCAGSADVSAISLRRVAGCGCFCCVLPG